MVSGRSSRSSRRFYERYLAGARSNASMSASRCASTVDLCFTPSASAISGGDGATHFDHLPHPHVRKRQVGRGPVSRGLAGATDTVGTSTVAGCSTPTRSRRRSGPTGSVGPPGRSRESRTPAVSGSAVPRVDTQTTNERR